MTELNKQARRIHELETQVRLLELQKFELEARYQDLLRRLFGPKSEKMDPGQLQLAMGSVEQDVEVEAAVAQSESKPAVAVKPRSGGGRRPLPAHLPVVRVVIDVPEAEREGMVQIREEVTEEIDYRPSQFIRRQIVRPVYASPKKDQAPVQAPAPSKVIAGSGVGTALIAHILVSRFCDHLPYYRLEQMAARQGVQLDRQRMVAWSEHAALLLQTPYQKLMEQLGKAAYVQADETAIKVMDPDRPEVTRPSWLWAYHVPNTPTLLFDFSLSRGQESPRRIFAPEWTGVIQTDGYSVYPALFEKHAGVSLAGCWAHARRAWVEAVDKGGAVVAEVLALIQKLYLVEAETNGLSPAERAKVRGLRSTITLAKIKALCDQTLVSALPASKVGKAAAYLVQRWKQLTLYAQPGYGHVVIDNNPTERGIRPTAIGKKNWLFIGHPDAGWRSAVIYSIVGSCKLAGVNPFDYLVWALDHLASATTTTVGPVLPEDYARTVKEQRPV